MAVGLGSMDMPVPAVAEWEWLNWKFPRAVHAGETIYARWTLTQKRAPVGGAPTAVVVWRVDVHTADGALCAEGEVGASVTRRVASAKSRTTEPAIAAAARAGVPEPAAATATAPAPRRRRGRRRPASDGAKNPVETKSAHVTEAALVAAPAAIPAAERSAGGTRRRRRRRSPGSTQARNGDGAAPAAAIEAPSAPAPAPAAPTGTDAANPLTRVMRRLRRSSE